MLTIVRNVVLGCLIVGVSFYATLRTLDYFNNPCRQPAAFTLSKPFGRIAVTGNGYFTTIVGVASSKSPVLCEDGWPLGPAKVADHEINSIGQGRYGFDNNIIKFSASNNSDPNVNNRIYTIVTAP